MTFKDEIITFQTPPYEHSVFVYDVDDNDISSLISLFSSFGLLYKSKRLLSTQSTFHLWFYSYNALQKLLVAFPNRKIPIPQYETRRIPPLNENSVLKIEHNETQNNNLNNQNNLNETQEMTQNVIVSYTEYTFSIPKNAPQNFTRRQLRLDQMYQLCNYYFGCQFWSSEIVNLSCDFKDEYVEKNVRKFSFQYTTVSKIRFLNFPECVLRGYGRSKYTGKDVIRADRTAKKFSIACARKDMFSRLIICILVDSANESQFDVTQNWTQTFNQNHQMKKDEGLNEIANRVRKMENTIRFLAIPNCVDIGKQDENGLNNLFIQNYDEDDEEMNKNLNENYRGEIYEMKKKEQKQKVNVSNNLQNQQMEQEDMIEDEDFLELLNEM